MKKPKLQRMQPRANVSSNHCRGGNPALSSSRHPVGFLTQVNRKIRSRHCIAMFRRKSNLWNCTVNLQAASSPKSEIPVLVVLETVHAVPTTCSQSRCHGPRLRTSCNAGSPVYFSRDSVSFWIDLVVSSCLGHC